MKKQQIIHWAIIMSIVIYGIYAIGIILAITGIVVLIRFL